MGTGARMGIGVGMVEAPGRGVLYMISPSSSMAAGIMGQEREWAGKEDRRARTRRDQFINGQTARRLKQIYYNSRLGSCSLQRLARYSSDWLPHRVVQLQSRTYRGQPGARIHSLDWKSSNTAPLFLYPSFLRQKHFMRR